MYILNSDTKSSHSEKAFKKFLQGFSQRFLQSNCHKKKGSTIKNMRVDRGEYFAQEENIQWNHLVSNFKQMEATKCYSK